MSTDWLNITLTPEQIAADAENQLIEIIRTQADAKPDKHIYLFLTGTGKDRVYHLSPDGLEYCFLLLKNFTSERGHSVPTFPSGSLLVGDLIEFRAFLADK